MIILIVANVGIPPKNIHVSILAFGKTHRNIRINIYSFALTFGLFCEIFHSNHTHTIKPFQKKAQALIGEKFRQKVHSTHFIASRNWKRDLQTQRRQQTHQIFTFFNKTYYRSKQNVIKKNQHMLNSRLSIQVEICVIDKALLEFYWILRTWIMQICGDIKYHFVSFTQTRNHHLFMRVERSVKSFFLLFWNCVLLLNVVITKAEPILNWRCVTKKWNAFERENWFSISFIISWIVENKSEPINRRAY